MRFLAVLLAALFLVAAPARAETELATPKPDWDNPRKIALQLTESDAKRVNAIFHNAINLQKFYGQDNVKVAIVAYGPGVRALLKGSAPAPDRVQALQDYGVEFVACGNTLTTIGKAEADLLPGVPMVTAGLADLVERQLKGWVILVP
jgi:uncharacterized protein